MMPLRNLLTNTTRLTAWPRTYNTYHNTTHRNAQNHKLLRVAYLSCTTLLVALQRTCDRCHLKALLQQYYTCSSSSSSVALGVRQAGVHRSSSSRSAAGDIATTSPASLHAPMKHVPNSSAPLFEQPFIAYAQQLAQHCLATCSYDVHRSNSVDVMLMNKGCDDVSTACPWC
eukprot:16689-Heterococcus_DN1.PRE.2